MKFTDLNNNKKNLDILNQYLKENFGITVSTNTTVTQVKEWMNSVKTESDMRKRVYLTEALKIVLREIAPKRKRKTNESILNEEAAFNLIDPNNGKITTLGKPANTDAKPKITIKGSGGKVVDITKWVNSNPQKAQK